MHTARLTLVFMLTAALLGGCLREAHPDESSPVRDGAATIISSSPPDTSSVPDAPDASAAENTTQPVSPPAEADSYFENALFLGDSVTESVCRYVRAQRNEGKSVLADARFLTDVSGIRIADLVGDTDEQERIRYQYKG